MKKIVIGLLLAVLLSMPFTAFAADTTPGANSIVIVDDRNSDSGS
ncbi:hypothetical protein [Novibacillus thermophilus]|nr:hypothetical protein [Novibacillus thermophilus]